MTRTPSGKEDRIRIEEKLFVNLRGVVISRTTTMNSSPGMNTKIAEEIILSSSRKINSPANDTEYFLQVLHFVNKILLSFQQAVCEVGIVNSFHFNF